MLPVFSSSKVGISRLRVAAILVLCPDAKDPALREVVFVRETNAHIAVWEGHKLTQTEATKVSGIATVKWTSEFESYFLVSIELMAYRA